MDLAMKLLSPEEGPGGDVSPIFAPLRAASRERPYLIAQIGQSLDGRVATPTGASRDISGAAGLDHLHRLRAHVDAVVVGAGTIRADDPQLTVRRVPGRSPARVVIDTHGRLPADARWQCCDGMRRILITACSHVAPDPVETIRLEKDGPIIPPAAIAQALFERGLKTLLIEGGPRTIAAFLEAGCLDRLHVLVSPVILGSGRTGLDLCPIDGLDEALRPKTSVHMLGSGDVLFDCDFSAARRE
jgi:riboflavin-specific deaminase-like protein